MEEKAKEGESCCSKESSNCGCGKSGCGCGSGKSCCGSKALCVLIVLLVGGALGYLFGERCGMSKCHMGPSAMCPMSSMPVAPPPSK